MEEATKIAEQIATLAINFKAEHDKAAAGNKAAAGRARKITGEIGKACKAYRSESVKATKKV